MAKPDTNFDDYYSRVNVPAEKTTPEEDKKLKLKIKTKRKDVEEGISVSPMVTQTEKVEEPRIPEEKEKPFSAPVPPQKNDTYHSYQSQNRDTKRAFTPAISFEKRADTAPQRNDTNRNSFAGNNQTGRSSFVKTDRNDTNRSTFAKKDDEKKEWKPRNDNNKTAPANTSGFTPKRDDKPNTGDSSESRGKRGIQTVRGSFGNKKDKPRR